MIANPSATYLTPEEYLQWEEAQELKFEYNHGEVFAMTGGGTLSHNSIALNLASALKIFLRGKKCKVFISDAKTAISEQGPFYYPDVVVTCDEKDLRGNKLIFHPILIAEVLSKATEAYDRGEKFQNYRRLDSLKEYILITAEKIYVEVFRLNDQNIWELHSYNEGEELSFTSLNFSGPVADLYEDVVFQN